MVLEMAFQLWLPVAFAVVMISIAITAIIYALSQALGNDEMKGWAQNEIYQAFASIVLLASAVALLSLINSIVYASLSSLPNGLDFSCDSNGCSYNQLKFNSADLVLGDPAKLKDAVKSTRATCGGDEPCHIAIAVSRLDMTYDIIRHYVANKIASAGTIMIIEGTSIGYSVFRITPFAVAGYITAAYSNFIDSINTMLLLLKVNSIFLVFISKALFPMFLIAGLALRSISFMRNVGGLMLSIALGLYFVYPMLLILSSVVISPNSNSFTTGYDDLSGFISPPVDRPNIAGPTTAASDLPRIDVTASNEELNQANGVLGNAATLLVDGFYKDVGGKRVDWISYQLFNVIMPKGFIDNAAFIVVWIGVPMVITIYGVLIFIKEFSSLVGGDVDIAGLSKLV